MAWTTGQKLIVGGIAAAVGIGAYWKFAEAQPFVAGLGLGAGAVIFGPAIYDWAFEAGERIRVPALKREVTYPTPVPPVAYSRP